MGNDLTLGQLTIRASDFKETLKFWEEALGMVILSHQDVGGFALYFLAGKDCGEPKPADPDAVELREKLWQQPFVTLEIQYIPGSRSREFSQFQVPKADESGFEGVVVGIPQGQKVAMFAKIKEVCGIEPVNGVIHDPNGIPIFFEEQ